MYDIYVYMCKPMIKLRPFKLFEVHLQVPFYTDKNTFIGLTVNVTN